MAFGSFNLVSAQVDTEVTTDRRFTRNETRVYLLKTTESEDEYQAGGIVEAQGFAAHAPHPTDPLSFLRKISINQKFVKNNSDRAGRAFDVTLFYSTETPDPERVSKTGQPQDDPILRTYRTEKVMRPLETDLDDTDVLNGANDPFDPPIEVQRSRSVYTFRQSRTDVTDVWVRAYVDHVNSGTWGQWSAGEVLCRDISAEEDYRFGQSFWRVTFEFVADTQGWQPAPLNAGYNYIDASDSNKKKRVLDDDQQEVSSPWPLTAAGDRIATASIPANVNYLSFTGYESADFNELGLNIDT